MTYTLLIVESPAKCKKIEGYLGNGYKCMASFGHITELSGLKSIDIDNNFKPSYTIMESKKQQISKLRKAIKEAKHLHDYTKKYLLTEYLKSKIHKIIG